MRIATEGATPELTKGVSEDLEYKGSSSKRPVISGADKGDQKRVMTPSDAIAAGSSHLVVARPIVKAEDPKAAALAILAEMDDALAKQA